MVIDMKRNTFSIKPFSIAVLCAALGASSASAEVVNLVQNGSFETTNWTGNRAQHGYVVHNGKVNGSIPNWTASSNVYGYGTTLTTEEFGKNTGSFDGDYALFIQRSGTLSQTITGLVPGELYTYSFNYDARNVHKESTILAKVGDLNVLNNVKYSTRNPFYDFEVTFRATEETMDISFANTHGNSDTSVLLDKVQLVESAADNPWTCSGTADLWLSDATIGVDSARTYTHTLNFGSAAADKAMINGVPFAKVAGKGATDLYSLPNAGVQGVDTGLQGVFGTANTGSNEMAKGFFTGMTGVTLTGLEPGVQYTTTFYLASWNNTIRTGDFTAPDGTSFILNENKLRTENGGRAGALLTWTGYASEDGTLDFGIYSPHSGDTVHIYGISNMVTPGQTPDSVDTNLLLATNFGGPNGNSYEGMKVIDTVADVVNFISPAGSEKWQLRENESSATVYSFVENGALRTGANSVNMMEIDSSLLAGKWIDISADLKINTLRGNEKPNARGIGIGFMDESKKTLQGEAGIGFSGLVLDPTGALMFYENANGSAIKDADISESIKYLSEDGSAFDVNDWYELDMTLAFSDDGTTATLLDVGLEGSAADYSALKGLTFETTDLFAVLSSSAASWNYYGFVDNVRVSEYVPEPSTWALLVLGAGSLFMIRRRNRK